jgi:hypothetical protein
VRSLGLRTYVRYYCRQHPKLRVMPYDSFEKQLRSAAPKKGKRGHQVLLASLNAQIPTGKDRWAYCWACGHFNLAFRRDSSEIRRLYLARLGIVFLNQGGKR